MDTAAPFSVRTHEHLLKLSARRVKIDKKKCFMTQKIIKR